MGGIGRKDEGLYNALADHNGHGLTVQTDIIEGIRVARLICTACCGATVAVVDKR